jgi:lipopolysaccharide/colanic/teichoic acid biosynthesis glycosyltransferase
MTVRELVLLLLAALFAALITDVFADWSCQLSKWLTRCAAARLPLEVANRCEEEWLGTLLTRARLLQPFFALDLFRASYVINHNRRQLGLSNKQSYLSKRLFDITLGCLALLFVFPVLVLTGAMVKASSRGPVLFKQRRYGLNGIEIVVYKFRTTRVDEDRLPLDTDNGRWSRTTRIGRFLRRTSLDELPQLVNVLQGRMSFVGPWPHPIAHNEMYREYLKETKIADGLLPGITGWAQINGLRGETGAIEQLKRRVRYDLDYIQNRSLWLDIKIVLATALMTLFEDAPVDQSKKVSTMRKRFDELLIQRARHMLRRLFGGVRNKSGTRD